MDHREEQIAGILERNKRVEADKAWEGSYTRRAFIAVLTYVTAYVFMRYNGLQNAGVQALLPAAAYIFSTLTLPPLKRWWIGGRSKG